jgi:hypothetical protein
MYNRRIALDGPEGRRHIILGPTCDCQNGPFSVKHAGRSLLYSAGLLFTPGLLGDT